MVTLCNLIKDKNLVFSFYNKILEKKWPVDESKFFDILMPPQYQDDSCFAVYDKSEIRGFIATQITESKRGSIILFLFDPKDENYANELLDAALDHFKKNGVKTIQFGTGSYTYFWQGVPFDMPNLISFFKKRNWKFTETSVDMWRELADYKTPPFIYERIQNENIRIDIIKPEKISDLLLFEKQHFPRWEKYFSETLLQEKSDEILVATTPSGEIVGSVLVGKRNILWKDMIGNNVGTIGTLGVAEKMRGKGIGLALAARATEILQEQGVETCYLSWTWLIDWYGKLGYKVWREYAMCEYTVF